MAVSSALVRAESAQLHQVDDDEGEHDHDRERGRDAEVVLPLEGDAVDQLDDGDRAVVGPALGQDVELLERQRATLSRTPPMRIATVMNEAVLTREVGGRKVMAELREHLLKLTSQPAVDLHVLPWHSGAHAAMGGPFQIVSFDDPDNPDVGYLETYEGVRYLEGADRLQTYRDRFDHVLRQSVPLEEYLR